MLSSKTAALLVVLLVASSLAGYFAGTSTLVPERIVRTTTVTTTETMLKTVTSKVTTVFTLGFPNPDIIFYDGIVLTMEEDQPEAQALAVQGDRILAVGSNEEILALRTQKTNVIDLEGRVLLPGFVDAHTHVFNDAMMRLGMSLNDAQQLALKNGITCLADMYVEPAFLNEMQKFAKQGELRVRTSLYLVYDTNCGIIEAYLGNWYKQHPPTRQPGEMLRIGGVKIFADGGSCGLPAVSYGDQKGDLWLTQGQLNEIVAEAQAAGYQVAIHALGDRAIEEAQNAIEFALAGKPNSLRHRIEHNTIVRPDLLHRYGEIGIVATFFGYFFARRVAAGELSWLFPREQQSWIWPYRALLDANPGLHVAWHSDYPWCGPISPQLQLYGLVTRNEVAENGTVCQAPDWLAANKIPVQEALRMMNIGAAYAIFREEEVGSLKPGKFADLVVLSENPLTVDPGVIKDIQVLLTMVGGRVEYCASGHEALCKPIKSLTTTPAMEISPLGLISVLPLAVILPVWRMRDVVLKSACFHIFRRFAHRLEAMFRS